MNTNRTSPSFILSSRVCALLTATIALGFTGCKDSAPSAQANAKTADAPLEAGSVEAAKVEAAAEVILPPARVSDAAEALDLSRVALLPDAEKPGDRSVINLMYRAPGKPEDGYKLHREQLASSGWKELPGNTVTPEYASAIFTKGGMTVSLTVMPEKAGAVSVALIHHGNVRFDKLPVPAGAKVTYAGPSTGIFTSELPVEKAASETAAALKTAGWQFIGAATPTQWFKQNAVKLSVMTVAAPAQGGKTTISFSSEMLPVDLPIPPSATNVQFANKHKILSFETEASGQETLDFYRQTLPKTGWETTMEGPARVDANTAVVFHNPAKDILRLGMRPGSDGKIKVSAEYRTGAEIAEMRSKYEAQLEAEKAGR